MKASALDLPFDQFQRHDVVARVLARIAPPDPRVLDVGGHPGHLRDFLPCRLVVVDRVATAGSVIADGTLLPFPRETFDAVVSTDALEHVPPASRSSFVAELLRVSRGPVVLAAPFADPAVQAAELALHEVLRSVRGGSYEFLRQHLELGLPRLPEVRGWMESFGARVAVLPSCHLPRWLPMMAVSFFLDAHPRYAALRPLLCRFYNGTFSPHDACEPAYRHVLVALQGDIDPGPAVADLVSAPGAAPAVEPGYVMTLLSELLHHAGGGVPDDAELLLRQVGFLAGRLAERERELDAAAGSRRELEAAYGALEGQAREARAAQDGAAAYARHLEASLAEARAAHDAAATAAERFRRDVEAVRAEYARLEGHTRGIEQALAAEREARAAESTMSQARARDLAAAAEEMGRLVLKAAEAEAALEAGRDRTEALRTHAENLAGIVERLSQRPLDRLLRKLRG